MLGYRSMEIKTSTLLTNLSIGATLLRTCTKLSQVGRVLIRMARFSVGEVLRLVGVRCTARSGLRGGRIILLIFFHRHHYFVVLGRHHSHPTIVRHLILFASPVLDLYLHSIIFITFPCSCPFSLSRTLFKVLSFDHISSSSSLWT